MHISLKGLSTGVALFVVVAIDVLIACLLGNSLFIRHVYWLLGVLGDNMVAHSLQVTSNFEMRRLKHQIGRALVNPS